MATSHAASSSKPVLSCFWTQKEQTCTFNRIRLVFEGATTSYSVQLPKTSPGMSQQLKFTSSKVMDSVEGAGGEKKTITKTVETLTARVDQLMTLRLYAARSSDCQERALEHSECPIALSVPDSIEPGAAYRLQLTGHHATLTATFVKEEPTKVNTEQVFSNLLQMLSPSLRLMLKMHATIIEMVGENSSFLVTTPSVTTIKQQPATLESVSQEAFMQRAIKTVYDQVSPEHLQKSAIAIAEIEAQIQIATPKQLEDLRSQFRTLHMNILGKQKLATLATNVLQCVDLGERQFLIPHFAQQFMKACLP